MCSPCPPHLPCRPGILKVNLQKIINFTRHNGGGGFLLTCENLVGRFDDSFPTCAFFLLLKWKLAHAHQFHSFSQDQFRNVLASRDNCGQVFPDELRVSSFPHYAWTTWSAHSDFIGSRLYAYLGVTCHMHLCKNDRGLLCAKAVRWGWNRHQIGVSTES